MSRTSRRRLDTASDLEHAFLTYWRMLGGPEDGLAREYVFHHERRWRLDYAFPGCRVAIELQGGGYVRYGDGQVGGRHHRAGGYDDDCAKANSLSLMGWRLFRFTSSMLAADPAGCLEPVIRLVTDLQSQPLDHDSSIANPIA